MIDRAARDGLAELLERLLRAEIKVNQFENEVYDRRFRLSNDFGVEAVSNVADNISEEVSVWRDRYLIECRVAQPMISRIRHAAHFLRSEQEYEWPLVESSRTPLVALFEIWTVLGFAILPLLGVLIGVALVVLGIMNVFVSWGIAKTLERRAAGRILRRWSAGRDPEVWPFARREDVPPELISETAEAAGPIR